MEFRTDTGDLVVVEIDHRAPGAKLVSRGDNRLVQAGRSFDDALQGIRSAAESALRVFRGGSLQPDGVELEFGVKLTGEAGAVIAKSAVEGHITVKLSWSPDPTAPTPHQPRAQAPATAGATAPNPAPAGAPAPPPGPAPAAGPDLPTAGVATP